MSEDLQSLLEKINRDGVEKAEAEAAKIIDAARAKAKALVDDAEKTAADKVAAGEKTAADYAARAQVTVKQAARDVVIEVEKAVTAMLVKLLASNVDKALADPATAAKLVAGAVESFTAKGDVEVAAGAKVAAALKASLAAKKNFTVVTDEAQGSGFSVKVDGGRVEHAFTGAVVAEELAKRLRPDLAALLK